MITLATLPNATAQEVFDQVAKHLLAQGKRSVLVPGGSCAYRGMDDRKCAAGCLIGDDEYSPDIESVPWHALADKGLVPKSHSSLIQALQTIHDTWATIDWAEGLEKIADEFYLSHEGLVH